MNARKMSFHSNSNIGLFAYVNEKFCLIGNVITEEQKKEIEETLEVPVYEILIAGTPLIGIFVNGNEDKIIIPSITKKEELEKLDELQIEYQIVDSKYTALGNNILIDDNSPVHGEDKFNLQIFKINIFRHCIHSSNRMKKRLERLTG